MQSIHPIVSKIGIDAAALLIALLCIFAPQKEARAIEFDFKTSLGYEVFITEGLPVFFSTASDEDEKKNYIALPSVALSLEFSFHFVDWFALSLEEELGLTLIFTSKTLVNLRFIYRNENFELAGKIGIGMYNLALGLRAGIALSYRINPSWTVGATINYTSHIAFYDEDEDITCSHVVGTMFHFAYHF